MHCVRTSEWPRLDSVPVTWHCSARSGQGAVNCKNKVNKKIIIPFLHCAWRALPRLEELLGLTWTHSDRTPNSSASSFWAFAAASWFELYPSTISLYPSLQVVLKLHREHPDHANCAKQLLDMKHGLHIALPRKAPGDSKANATRAPCDDSDFSLLLGHDTERSCSACATGDYMRQILISDGETAHRAKLAEYGRV